jgi:hypothetical protein
MNYLEQPMIVNKDMDNGFRPIVGQKVRVVGRCHPRLYGKVVIVTETDEESHTISYKSKCHGMLSTSGLHGGLEPVNDDSPIWEDD